MILTDADQLREALRAALAERDDLRSRLAAMQETNAATMRVIAEAQRDTCARELRKWHDYVRAFRAVRAAPLVTEGDK